MAATVWRRLTKSRLSVARSNGRTNKTEPLTWRPWTFRFSSSLFGDGTGVIVGFIAALRLAAETSLPAIRCAGSTADRAG
jgi:hypothetical protein